MVSPYWLTQFDTGSALGRAGLSMASKLLTGTGDRMPNPKLSATAGVTPQSSRAPEQPTIGSTR